MTCLRDCCEMIAWLLVSLGNQGLILLFMAWKNFASHPVFANSCIDVEADRDA